MQSDDWTPANMKLINKEKGRLHYSAARPACRLETDPLGRHGGCAALVRDSYR
jgi:hypothetical protein